MSGADSTPSFAGSSSIRSGRESLVKWTLFACAAVSVLITLGIVATLFFDAVSFFLAVDPLRFFTGTEWAPAFSPQSYGVLPLVSGTLVVTVVSGLIAIPIGVAAAAYLSEYAGERTRSFLKPALEVLAGIPTVVYGFFALAYLTPALAAIGLPVGTFNALSASIMVGIMIVPMVSSLSEDAMSAVPDSLRQAGYGLGATKYEVTTGVVIPASLSGILSSFILALSRAIGETMIVVVAMGMSPRMFDLSDPAASLTESGQTMTSAMVELVGSDIGGGSVGYKSMFAIGLTLFVMTFGMNVLSSWIASQYREEYE